MKKLVLVSSLMLAAGGAFAGHHGKSDAAPAATPNAAPAAAKGQETAKAAHEKKSHGKETSAAAKAKNDDKPADAPGQTK